MKQRLIMWLAVVAGVVLLLAAAWAAILWTRPEPIRIAFASSLSGPSAPAGTESLVATQLAIDEVNAKGGVNGRPIELVLFDDASNPAVARANVQAIADSPCVAVLGHYLSSASLAAGPAYKDARIPALTGSAAADDLTSGNEYYFRALTPISAQARSIAEHLRAVMGEPKVRLVHTRDAYGESFVSGFAAAYPLVQWRVFGLDVASGQIGSMDEALDAAAQEPGPGVIVIGAAADFVADIVKALRRRGIKGTIIASQGAARESYLQNFVNEPEEKAHPGFFSENLYAASSLIFDSAGVAAQAFAADYKTKAGTSPSWVAGGAYDAARLMIEALKRADVKNRSDSKIADRDRVRVALGCDRQSEIGGRWADWAALFQHEPRHSAPDPAGFLPLRPVRYGAAATRAHRSAQWHRSRCGTREAPCRRRSGIGITGFSVSSIRASTSFASTGST